MAKTSAADEACAMTGNGKTYDVYIVQCADGTLYTGYAADARARVKAHNGGQGAKYTRSRLPVKLVYARSFPTKSEAMKEEARIKRLSREEKMKMIAGNQTVKTKPTK